MAESIGQPVEAFRKNLAADTEKFIEDYLLRKKALDLIVEKASIKEEKVMRPKEAR